MAFWSCPPEWAGETAFVVAGGTSVNDVDLSTLTGRRVIAVNSSAFSVPWADFLVWNDRRWWVKHGKALVAFAGRIVTTDTEAPFGVLHMRKVKPEIGISPVRTELAMHRTTTQAAMNLAAHLGVSRIVLLGVDLCERNGRRHHHEEHPWPPMPDAFEAQARNLRATVAPLRARGIEVVNCSPISTIEWWRKSPLEEVLADVRQPVAGLDGTHGGPDRRGTERSALRPPCPTRLLLSGGRHQ